MKIYFSKFWNWIKPIFCIDEGGKKVLNTKRLKYIFSSLLGITILVQAFMTKDDSVLSKSHKAFESDDKVSGNVTTDHGESIVKAHNMEAQMQVRPGKSHSIRPVKLTYNGRQVFERQETQGLLSPIPSGTNFIGKLVTGIDTRQDNQTLKVILPYGGSHPAGGKIPRDSILLGSASYSGGDRVYLRFNRIIFPNGTEYRIDAQGLSSGDYTPGLIGNHHSETDLRVAGAIGLTLISAGADVMTQRTTLGGNPYGMAVAQPDATFKNAGLQGVSQVTKQEAERVGSKMQDKEEYLTLMTGGDLIVSLLTPFKGEPL
ncbi:MAG: TrbI/VirB10 family protein [Bacteriovoracaceae bacterium]|nr:TrbI/VirB10 family protein [Bacteriovoracaceae bacterium]